MPLAKRSRMRSIAWLLLLAACSGSGSSGPADDGDFELTCESQGATFPLLDKTCSVASDCFVARHMINCCGTQVAIGLNVASESEFGPGETACASAYPACGCAPLPPAAEDGRTEAAGTIEVECVSQRCTTFVP